MRLGWLLAPVLGAGVFAASQLRKFLSDYTFKDKVVLITGGSRGLGLVLARHLAAEGAKLALIARDEVELLRAQRSLEHLGADVETFICDVTEDADVKRAVARVVETFGRLDVLINNAGVTQVGSLATLTDSDFQEAMAINFWGPLHMTMEALPHLRKTHDGRIINISSIGGKLPAPHMLPYSASKFALTGLSEGMRAELLDDGVKITTVCPGLMRTGSPRNATFKGRAAAKEYEWFSVADSLPIITMSAERAAKKILDAARVGQSEVVLTWYAKLATWFHAVFPGFTSATLWFFNHLLPTNEDARYSFLGKATGALHAHPWLTKLNERAALRNNEA